MVECDRGHPDTSGGDHKGKGGDAYPPPALPNRAPMAKLIEGVRLLDLPGCSLQ